MIANTDNSLAFRSDDLLRSRLHTNPVPTDFPRHPSIDSPVTDGRPPIAHPFSAAKVVAPAFPPLVSLEHIRAFEHSNGARFRSRRSSEPPNQRRTDRTPSPESTPPPQTNQNAHVNSPPITSEPVATEYIWDGWEQPDFTSLPRNPPFAPRKGKSETLKLQSSANYPDGVLEGYDNTFNRTYMSPGSGGFYYDPTDPYHYAGFTQSIPRAAGNHSQSLDRRSRRHRHRSHRRPIREVPDSMSSGYSYPMQPPQFIGPTNYTLPYPVHMPGVSPNMELPPLQFPPVRPQIAKGRLVTSCTSVDFPMSEGPLITQLASTQARISTTPITLAVEPPQRPTSLGMNGGEIRIPEPLVSPRLIGPVARSFVPIVSSSQQQSRGVPQIREKVSTDKEVAEEPRPQPKENMVRWMNRMAFKIGREDNGTGTVSATRDKYLQSLNSPQNNTKRTSITETPKKGQLPLWSPEDHSERRVSRSTLPASNETTGVSVANLLKRFSALNDSESHTDKSNIRPQH